MPQVIDHLARRRIAGVNALAVGSAAEAALTLCDLAVTRKGNRGRHVHLVNAYCLALADQHSEYKDLLSDGALNFPDGKPLSWISRLRRDDPPLRQVRGPRLFLDTCDVGRQVGLRHYLLGGSDEVLATVVRRLNERYPGIDIVGQVSPPFRALTSAEQGAQDEAIRESGAHIVWVALGTPKQDLVTKRLADAIPVVAVAVGAAFDFTAGRVAVAPEWMRIMGLEWFFRLCSEPGRLWRRYLLGNPRFLLAAGRDLLRQRSGG